MIAMKNTQNKKLTDELTDKLMNEIKSIVGVLLMAVVTGLAQPTEAFTLTGTFEAAWPDPEVKFVVNTANCPASIDVVSLLQEAAKLWNNVPTSKIKVSYGGATTSTTDSSPPTVYCATNFGAVTGADQGSTIGVGRGSPSVLNGPITSGLLILNASAGAGNISNQPPEALKLIMAHEIGHVLGLGHSQDPTALMWYTASGKMNAALSQDDVDGISYLYPRNEIGGDKIMGCGLVGAVAGGWTGGRGGGSEPPTGSALALALFLLLPLLIAIHSRRRNNLYETLGLRLSNRRR